MATRLRVAMGILMVKDRIQQFYKRQAQEEGNLNEFKKKHGYCIGRAFCMNQVADDVLSCDECRKANSNPRYKRKQSAYGRMRQQEREAERKEREFKKTRRKKAA